MTTVHDLLAAARTELAASSDTPELDSQVLLAHVLRRERSWLFAWPEFRPDAATLARFREQIARRRAGHPVGHLTGQREFWSLVLRVDEHTLIPRPETELLVETALGLDLPGTARVLDLGTGSGAIALALAGERPAWQLTGIDRSVAALAVARGNAERLGLGRIAWLAGDWFGALAPDRHFDLVVANPPYIAAADPHLERGDLRFEPRSALVGGPDGLAAIRRIVAEAPHHLTAGGWLWLEHGSEQADRVDTLLRAAGFVDRQCRRDLAGHERLSGGRLAGHRYPRRAPEAP